MTRKNRIMVVGTSALAAFMLGLTGYVALTGDEESDGPKEKGKEGSASASPKPGPSYQPPDDWSEPTRWASLPRGKKTDSHGNDVGFPHTTNGAVAMLAASTAMDAKGGRTVVDEQVGIYDSYMSKEDHTAANKAKVRAGAKQRDAQMRQQVGISGQGDLPAGAYVRSNVIGFKVIKKSADEVSVYLLSRVTMKGNEVDKEKSSYARSVLAGQWEDKDWKVSTAATAAAAQEAQTDSMPAIAAPGDVAFNKGGWTAIREAS
ncbi:hypothetical protein [Streptomyces sp. NPDC048636]|uniref:hypothetical protein n=1 Tax=Streptomyces sp. NPDC048636 TaxID=3155762 RepID=UPI00341D274B